MGVLLDAVKIKDYRKLHDTLLKEVQKNQQYIDKATKPSSISDFALPIKPITLAELDESRKQFQPD